MSRFLFFIGRCLFRLRYQIVLKEYDTLFKAGLHQSGNVLFLPNHPAEIDPIILFAYLGSTFHPRPLVVEHFFFMRGVSFFMKLVKAVPIPNFTESASKWKMRRAEKIIENIQGEMHQGENFIIYPGGNLRTTDHEIIGGNSLIHKLLSESKTIHPVLIRTTGLWGSRFSRAIDGKLPDFWKVLFKEGLWTLIKNGIFFAPRRKLEIEFFIPEEKSYKGLSRLQLNKFLEDWYNCYPGGGNREPLSLVSSSHFRRDVPAITQKKTAKIDKKEFHLEKEKKKLILDEVADLSGKSSQVLNEDMDLAADLGLDSLDVAGLHAFLSENFDIPKISPGDLKTIYDLFETAAGEKIPSTASREPFLPKTSWNHKRRKPVSLPEGDTLMEAFLRSCDRMGNADACGDEVSGVLSYKKFKLTALILADRFRHFKGDRVGILLPSSIGASLCILAVLLAKKIPVMLNWTVGKRALEYSSDLSQLSEVLTSMRFLDRLENIDFGHVEEKFLFMEEIKKEISLSDKLKGIWRSRQKASTLLKKLHLDTSSEEDIAVILFTSGTETHPKGVPLTHSNILNNQKDAFATVSILDKDIFLGALPPFHSFGFTVTGLFPLISGLRVFYAPDPTDGSNLARIINKFSPTILILAPSFYKYLFRLATKEQLSSVRLLVTGAEKSPQEFFEYAKELGKTVIEGYGITECSPIVTLCRENDPPIGVGKPIPHVEIVTIHPETQKLLKPTEEGEICIKSPGVFHGYFGEPERNPFIEINEKKWYRSGDIGYVDEEGNLILKDRLKRFVKIGGEMVSLGAVESELTLWARNFAPQEDDKPFLAITAKEKEGEKTTLICVATFPVQLDEINSELREKGFGQIVKVSKVEQVDEIPLTGTGKIHYRMINEMIS